MATKEDKTDQSKRLRCDHKGDFAVTTTFTAPPLLLTRADDLIISRVRDGGFKCNRSRVIQAMLTIAMDAAEMIDADEITDSDSLTRELKRAICEKEGNQGK